MRGPNATGFERPGGGVLLAPFAEAAGGLLSKRGSGLSGGGSEAGAGAGADDVVAASADAGANALANADEVASAGEAARAAMGADAGGRTAPSPNGVVVRTGGGARNAAGDAATGARDGAGAGAVVAARDAASADSDRDSGNRKLLGTRSAVISGIWGASPSVRGMGAARRPLGAAFAAFWAAAAAAC